MGCLDNSIDTVNKVVRACCNFKGRDYENNACSLRVKLVNFICFHSFAIVEKMGMAVKLKIDSFKSDPSRSPVLESSIMLKNSCRNPLKAASRSPT
jgi:hypothetical protein